MIISQANSSPKAARMKVLKFPSWDADVGPCNKRFCGHLGFSLFKGSSAQAILFPHGKDEQAAEAKGLRQRE